MQVVSYFCSMQKHSTIFQSGKFVNPPTRSLDSPYTEHGNPQSHTSHHQNWLIHEYIKHDYSWLNRLYTHSSCQPRNDRFQKWHFTILTEIYYTGGG